MNLKLQLLAATFSAGILMLAACGSDDVTSPPEDKPGATPDVPSTITSRVQRAVLGTPTPTPVPAAARAAALNFAAAHRTISEDWDQFHTTYDNWRQGLGACTASSFRSSLQGFAGRFAEVTEASRSLPRSAVVRGLADTLIEAAELEEEALRHLRDTWQPGVMVITESVMEDVAESDSAEASGSSILPTAAMFERVDSARAAASALRQEVVDSLIDREADTSAASVASVSEFVAIFNSIDTAWDDFHRQYDALRSAEGQITSGETVNQLGLLIDRFRDIVITIRQLPTIASTRPVAERLAFAAEQEDLSLRRLRDTFQLVGEPVPETNEEPVESENSEDSLVEDEESNEGTTTSSEETAGGESEVTFEPIDPTLFDAFDTRLVETNGQRLEARRTLEHVLEDISEESQIEVQDFTGPYNQLLRDWDSFHTDYNEWRNSEGGCDRAKATKILVQLNVTFGKISSAVRDLPPATVLRPMAEILVEAAEREERALRNLRNTWRPNDPEVYQNLDRERSTAGKLRRQVTTGIQELLERYGISPQE